MDPVAPQDSQNLGVPNPIGTPISSIPESQTGVPPSSAVPPPVGTPPTGPQAPLVTVQTQEPLTSGDGENKKKVFMIGGVVLFLLIVIGAAIYFAPRITSQLAQNTQTEAVPTTTPEPAIASAKVSYLEGAAWTVLGEEKTLLYEDAEVTEGQVLETGEDARLVLSLEGGSILRLGPSTKVTLTNLDSLDLAFSEDTGTLFAYVEKGVGRFMVTAGEVSVEAVGTAFSVEKKEEVRVNVYESKVKVKEGQTTTEIVKAEQWSQGDTTPKAIKTQDLSSDNFLQWALEEELRRVEEEIASQINLSETASKEEYLAALEALNIDKRELVKQAFLKTTTGDLASITLSGEKTPEGTVSLSWISDGLAEGGFALLWSTTPSKPYPGDKKTYTSLYAYEKTLGPIKPGTGTGYFRVCEWTGETCGIYSNELYFSF